MASLGPILLLTIFLFLIPRHTQCKHRALKTCGPGHELRDTGKNGVRCKRCRSGFYSDRHATPCTPCNQCKHGVKKKCTRKKNTVCHVKHRKTASTCAILMIFGRHKQFKKHCEKFAKYLRTKCNSRKKCLMLDWISENEIKTVSVSSTTSQSTVSRTSMLSTQQDSLAIAATSVTPSTTSTGTSTSSRVEAHFAFEEDANYEEMDRHIEDQANGLQWFHYIIITGFSFLCPLVLIMGSFCIYRKITSKRKWKPTNQGGQFYWGTHSTLGYPTIPDADTSICDDTIPSATRPSAGTTRYEPTSIQNINEHEQETTLAGFQLSVITPNEKTTKRSRAQKISCHMADDSQFDFDVKRAIEPFQKSLSLSNCQTTSESVTGFISNTLPLTKKERAMFGATSSNIAQTWLANSQTYVPKYLTRITSLTTLAFQRVISTTSDDTIRFCSNKDLSMSKGGVENDISTQVVSENIVEERLGCYVCGTQTGSQFSLAQDSSLGLSICDPSPDLSHKSSINNDSDSMDTISDSGVEEFGTDEAEGSGSAVDQYETCRDVIIANNEIGRDQGNRGTKCIVRITNYLHIQKPKETSPENIFENLYKTEGTQTHHNSENTRSIYGHPWNTSCHFTNEGGKLTKPNSDIVLDVPSNAVPEGETAFVQGLFTVDFTDIHCHLSEDEVIVSPVAEFQMSFIKRWGKVVKIVLPCVHRNPKETFKVRFYQRNKQGDVKYGDVAPHDSGVNQELYYVNKVNHVEIYTIHFTGFFCSVCHNTFPLELTALVFGCYGKHDNEAWISLHIADKRLEIPDFQQSIVDEERNLNQAHLCAKDDIRLLEESDCNSRLEFSLDVRSQPQLWGIIGGQKKQMRRLQELVKCSCSSHECGGATRNIQANHTCHHKLKWVFKPNGEPFPTSISCNIHAEHVLQDNNVTERFDACDEGITDIIVPPIQISQISSMGKTNQSLRESMAFGEVPSSRKPMFSRRQDT